jgi:Mor family transcriptional regulator
VTETVLSIMQRMARGTNFDVQEFLEQCGGRVWVIPSPRSIYYARLRMLVLTDPSRDYKDLMRRYPVSRSFIYTVWKSARKGAVYGG